MNSNSFISNGNIGAMILAAAALVSIFFILFSRKKNGASSADDTDLDARYQSLLKQLKEHEQGRHLLPAAEWEAQRSSLEQQAANILREKGNAQHEKLKETARKEKLEQIRAADTGFLASNPTLKGALIGGSVVFFFAALAFFLTQETKPRDEKGMGPMQMGSTENTTKEEAVDPELEALVERVNANPNDVNNLTEAVAQLAKRQMWSDVETLIERATHIDPYNTQVRLYRSLLEVMKTKSPESIAQLSRIADVYDEQPPFVKPMLEQLRSQPKPAAK